jgi:hypothetical protein
LELYVGYARTNIIYVLYGSCKIYVMFEYIRLCLSLLLSVSVVPLPRYSYSEAPEFPGNDFTDDPVDSDPADSFASFDTGD